MEDADNTGPKKELCSAEWKRSLPDDAGDVRDISDQACWTLSSCKTGTFGKICDLQGAVKFVFCNEHQNL